MAKEIELAFARFSAQDPQTIGTFIMKHNGVMRVLILLAAVAAILGAYTRDARMFWSANSSNTKRTCSH